MYVFLLETAAYDDYVFFSLLQTIVTFFLCELALLVLQIDSNMFW